jgi:hypothetical protein
MDIRKLHRPDQQHPIEYPVPNGPGTFTLWLEFEWWGSQPDDDPEINFFNMQIDFSDGRRYALNVWTYKYLAVARQDDLSAGDHLNGAYQLPPDLFVTRLDRSQVAAVVTDLIQEDLLREEWRIPEETMDDPSDEDGEDRIFATFVERLRAEGRIIDSGTHTPTN